MGSERFSLEMRNIGVSNEKWANANCHNRLKEDEEEEEEEALSLCDLPTVEDLHNPPPKESPKPIESLEEFNFFSSGRDSLFDDSELCAADDVFFQGQILPMRHSVSSDRGYTQLRREIIHNSNQNKCISGLEAIDHCSSGGFTSGSSRSSSISSRHSSSSVNSTSTTSATTASAPPKNKLPRTRVLNHFQYSHPSPKPQFRASSTTKNGTFGNPNSRSALWSLFRVGLVATPEIDIQDLKFRTNGDRKSATIFGSRNSTSSSNSNVSDNEKKRQKFFFNKNAVLFGSCKCSASTIGTVNSRIAVMKRKESAEEERHANHDKQGRAGKQTLSRRRTFEWLKQLSLETATDEL